MAEQVKVPSKDSLTTLSDSIKLASEYYDEGTKEAKRSFDLKTSDQTSAALIAFVDKINNLSNQVFSVYPGLLKSFATELTDYAGKLEGEGFPDKTYTDSDGITNIKDWLKNQRFNSISEKAEKLNKAFSSVAGVLAENPASVELSTTDTGDTVELAQEELSNRAKAWQDKHDNLIDHKDTFIQNLATVESDLQTTQNFLLNALQLGGVPATDFISWIISGSLNEQNIGIIDALQEGNDAEVMKALLSDKTPSEKMEAIGNTDPEQISQGMMNIVYAENIKYLDDYQTTGNEESLKGIETFVVTITGNGHTEDYVQTYMVKLGAAGEIYASQIAAQATSIIPDLDDYGTDYDRYIKDFNESQAYISTVLAPNMDTAHSLSSLFDTIAAMEMGKYENKGLLQAGDTYTKTLSIADGTLTFTNGDFGFETTGEKVVMEMDQYHNLTDKSEKIGTLNTDKDDTVKVSPAKDYKTVSRAENIEAMKEIQEQKKDAVNEYWKGVVKDGVNAMMPPGFDVVSNVVMDLSTMDENQQQAMADVIGDGKEFYDGKYASGVHIGVDAALGAVELASELEDYDNQYTEQQEDMQNNLYNVGGNTYSYGENLQGGNYIAAYDLQSITYADDLEKNGVKGYVAREAAANGQDIGEQVFNFEKKVDDSKYDNSSKQFLKGESKKSLENYGIKNVNNDFLNMTNYIGLDYEGEYDDKVNAQFDRFESQATQNRVEES